MTLAKNANTEPKDAKYNKRFIASQLPPYRPRVLDFAYGRRLTQTWPRFPVTAPDVQICELICSRTEVINRAHQAVVRAIPEGNR
jgi:hypothetical protein